ncbi:Ig-like domain-containing protein [Methanobrevibacter sp. AbM4]|uniref:beta strand repeat-containing protein n=1 Tax=Methanobrevibacter sp. AbM4 TaxID=224719 RepID=UPI0003348189|nr:Ig-like domain-containing protein [Methanobrevibacter sp. AbM4]AGN16492.1 adhesin-like protein [Methanobrevibacter sp. AbM4]
MNNSIKKSSIFVMVLFSLFIIISGISATDNSSYNTDFDSNDLYLSSNNTINQVDSNSDILKDEDTNQGSFSDLNTLISNSSVINLDKSYKYNPDSDSNYKNGLIINKTVRINGNNYTINTNGGAKLFDIKGNGTLILINVNLINNYSSTKIINNNGNLFLTNCNFTNRINSAPNMLTPIYSTGNLTIENSIFKDSVINSSRMITIAGGLIENYKGNLTIRNTQFLNNGLIVRQNTTAIVTVNGLLIYNSGGNAVFNNLTVSNNFANLNATSIRFFGFILNSGNNANMTVRNCNLNQNIPLLIGKSSVGTGVLRSAGGNLYVSNSNFSNNIGYNAGSIYNGGNSTIVNSVFYKNSVSNCGGAIFNEGNLSSINNSFIANAAKNDGGAIHNYGYYDTGNYDKGNVYIENNIFDLNNVETVSNADKLVLAQGGAIYSYSGNLTIINSNFTNNKAIGANGGVISNRANNFLNISKSIFVNNTATQLDIWPNSTGLGGVIFIAETEMVNETNPATFDVSYSIFDNNRAEIGDVISSVNVPEYPDYEVGVKANNNFWGTNNPDFNKLIHNYQNTETLVPNNYVVMDINSNELNDTKIKVNKPYIFNINLNKLNDSSDCSDNLPDYLVTLNNLISSNVVNTSEILLNKGSGSFGYASNVYGNDTIFIYLANDIMEDNPIVNITLLTVSPMKDLYVNLSYVGESDGTSDKPYTNLKDALDSIYLDNDSVIHIASGVYTGVNNINQTITNNNLTIRNWDDEANVIFNGEKNTNLNGGILTFTGDGLLTLINLTFVNGSANTFAGAIYSNGSGSLNIIDCNFTSNNAYYGGAILSYGAVYINNTVFDSNKANNNAGAIQANTVYAFNSNFTNNNGSYRYGRGGSVYSTLGGNFTSCNFIGGRASLGGAIACAEDGTVNVSGSTFIGNGANVGGGAIYSQKGLNIDNSTFIKNYANISNRYASGGAVSTNYANISNSTFIDNYARYTGGAISIQNDVNVTKSIFVNNTASSEGGAIWSYGDVSVDYSIFERNNASYGKAVYYTDVYSLSNNWWGNNTPSFTNLIYSRGNAANISNWVVIKINGPNTVYVGELTPFNITFNTLNTGEKLVENLPEYKFKLYNNVSENIILDNISSIDGNLTFNYLSNRLGNDTLIIANDYERLVFKDLNITKKDTMIDINVDEDNHIVIIGLKDIDGNVLPGASLHYSINGSGENSVLTNEDGSVLISGVYGDYVLFVNFAGNDSYNPSSNSAIISLKAPIKNTVIVFSNMTQKAVDFYKGERGRYFSIILKDTEGNALVNKTVQLTVSGVVYNKTTDSNGIAKLQINLNTAKNHKILIYFSGDDQYNSSMAIGNIHVIKKDVKITENSNNKKSVKINKYKTLHFYVKGQNAIKGTYIQNPVGRKVKVTIKGRTYNLKVNSKGIVTLKVKINKAGTYKIVTKFLGDNTYGSKTYTSKLVVKR